MRNIKNPLNKASNSIVIPEIATIVVTEYGRASTQKINFCTKMS